MDTITRRPMTSASANADMPDPSFRTTTTTWEGRLADCRDLWSASPLSDSVLDATPLRDVDWATLFAYMHRRFGPPHVAGDDYKDLTAGWMLSTPDASVFVSVTPSLSGPGFSFTPRYPAYKDDCGQTDQVPSQARIHLVRQAYRATLLDLQRPVCVRDSWINATGMLGESKRDQALLSCPDEDEEIRPMEAMRHESACWPMPLGFFGGPEWGTLCNVIRELGQGDMQIGRRVLVNQLRAQVFEDARLQSLRVKQLMLVQNHDSRSTLQAGLHLRDEDLLPPDTDLVSSFMDIQADVKTATSLLKRLGLDSKRLEAHVRLQLIDYSTQVAYKDLQAVPVDDFPPGAIPAMDANINLAEHMRSCFESSNSPELIAWLDRTLAKPYGSAALSRIAIHIYDSKRKEGRQRQAN